MGTEGIMNDISDPYLTERDIKQSSCDKLREREIIKDESPEHSFDKLYDLSVTDDGLAGYEFLSDINVTQQKSYENEMVEASRKIEEMMEKVFTDDGKVSWSCKECKKSSYDKTRIRKHVEVHIPGIYYKCPFCIGKKLSSKNSLEIHLYRTHSSNK